MGYSNIIQCISFIIIKSMISKMSTARRSTGIGRASGSRYMARLRATGADWGLDIKNNIRWMTVVTYD